MATLLKKLPCVTYYTPSRQNISLSTYRQFGFVDALSTAKELWKALNIEPALKEKGPEKPLSADKPISDGP